MFSYCTQVLLEFHHEKPFGLGGDHSPDNVRLACWAHNALFAERDYGKEKMARYRTNGSRLSEPLPVYYASPSWLSPLGPFLHPEVQQGLGGDTPTPRDVANLV